MTFEWDDAKAEANLRKHGVSFEEAQLVFEDEFNIGQFDDTHSNAVETRFKILGIGNQRIVLVIYVVRDEVTETYRIISARKAHKALERIYWHERKRHERSKRSF